MFKTMTGVLDTRENPTQAEIQKIPSYIFCRWLSGNPVAIHAANAINQYPGIPIEAQFQMIREAFGGKIRFIPYPKKHQETQVQHAEYLQKYFKLSPEKAREYLELISDAELQNIINLYEGQR